jgi:hypothetical protein
MSVSKREETPKKETSAKLSWRSDSEIIWINSSFLFQTGDTQEVGYNSSLLYQHLCKMLHLNSDNIFISTSASTHFVVVDYIRLFIVKSLVNLSSGDILFLMRSGWLFYTLCCYSSASLQPNAARRWKWIVNLVPQRTADMILLCPAIGVCRKPFSRATAWRSSWLKCTLRTLDLQSSIFSPGLLAVIKFERHPWL